MSAAGKYVAAKPLKGFGGAGVLEVRADDQGGTFRAVYTVRFRSAVYVLHVFQKKSKAGIATPAKELEKVKARLKLAAAHHMPAIVLKGGVAALTSTAPVDLNDVDVLVRPPDAERLAALLDQDGFHAAGPGGTVHLAQRVAPNAVDIEVHFALSDVELNEAMWSRARPLDGVAGLSRLGPADFLWHVLVHSVAYAPPEELKADFVNTSREGFRIAHDVSVYSLVALSRAAAPLMEVGGSVITMTYYGAEKVVPHYNVMGVAKAALECAVRYLANDLGPKKIRVNAISAGPIKTLAARGISGLGEMLKSHSERAPLKRNVDVNEVGSTGVFLASDASSGITGEVIYVDCGYNIMGF